MIIDFIGNTLWWNETGQELLSVESIIHRVEYLTEIVKIIDEEWFCPFRDIVYYENFFEHGISNIYIAYRIYPEWAPHSFDFNLI